METTAEQVHDMYLPMIENLVRINAKLINENKMLKKQVRAVSRRHRICINCQGNTSYYADKFCDVCWEKYNT